MIQNNPCEDCEYDNDVNLDFQCSLVYLSAETIDLLKKYNELEPGSKVFNKDKLIFNALEHLLDCIT